MEPCGVLVFFPVYSSLRVKFALPIKDVVVWECNKSHFGGRKGQMVNLGSETPKQPKCLQIKGKPNNTIGLMTRIGLELAKIYYKTRKRMPKGQMVPLSCGHRGALVSVSRRHGRCVILHRLGPM